MNSKNITLLFAMLIALLSASTFAGSQKQDKNNYSADHITRFAKQVENLAAEQGAYVFIIARAGRPASDMPKGINYTHTALAVYSQIQLESGEIVNGYAIHNLYQKADAANRSELVIDYPVDFFWGVEQLEAGIAIPTPELQKKILALISANKTTRLHNPKYSVIANPYNNKYQNCTEYTLNIINSAIYGTIDMEKLKVNTKAYFKAQKVSANPIKLMLGQFFVDEVSTSDHRGKVQTATFTTITQYLEDYGLLQTSFAIDEHGQRITL